MNKSDILKVMITLFVMIVLTAQIDSQQKDISKLEENITANKKAVHSNEIVITGIEEHLKSSQFERITNMRMMLEVMLKGGLNVEIPN